MFITKTIYLEYLNCAKNTWLKMHKPELAASFELSAFEKSLVANGNLVELWARKLFPKGVLIPDLGETAPEITRRYIEEKQSVIFQPTFVNDKFLVRNDVLEYDDKNNLWNLYEIKGTNATDENDKEIDHVEDATFQYIVLGNVGVKVGRVNIIHLNKEYVRGEEINVKDLFIFDDITEKVLSRIETTKQKMTEAVTALFQDDEKALECQCIYSGRSQHCSTFHYSHPHVPEYSVHDLSRIGSSKKRLAKLIDSEIFELGDIPEDFELTDNQKNQVIVHNNQRPMINSLAIKEELGKLIYPLYFFDYETYPSAIPLFKGFKPYQQAPFQFSLHVLKTPEGELEHYEYLHLDASDPTESVIAYLKKYIGPEGNIIVWNKKFEKGINTQLAERSLENKDFLEDLNNRIYDLMEIFQKQLHVHHGFKGRVSIKKVLPVLVPELSYKTLDIQEGGAAMDAWFEKIFNSKSDEEKKKTAESLLKYCYLDTFAMYAIWRELRNI
jgi:hypothetical protein